MSTLAATCSDGYYIPPDSMDKKRKSSLLKEKSNLKKNKTTVIRFALPYDGICNNCGYFLTKGLRFNAIKQDTGLKYVDIKIYEFQNMKCIECKNSFIISSDPKNSSYIYGPGIKKRTTTTTTTTNDDDDDDEEEDNNNSMKKLELQIQDKKMKTKDFDEIEYLYKRSKKRQEDNFQINQELRFIHRNKRKELKILDQERISFGLPQHILLPTATTTTTTTTTTTVSSSSSRWDNSSSSSIISSSTSIIRIITITLNCTMTSTTSW